MPVGKEFGTLTESEGCARLRERGEIVARELLQLRRYHREKQALLNFKH